MEKNKRAEEVLRFANSIQWLGHASVRIPYKGHLVYIDPFQLKSFVKADLILITHDHFDHLSIPDIAKIAGQETRFVVAGACAEKLRQAGFHNVLSIAPGSKVTILGLGITAVAAYNISRDMHPKTKNYTGFIIDFNGIRVYHTGDTERIPEMKNIACDIIMVPLGQKFTMKNVSDAAGAVLDSKAGVAIPIHWGLYEGSAGDVKKFGEILKKSGIKVVQGSASRKD